MSDYKENQFYPIWSLIELINTVFNIEARWYYGNTRKIVNIAVIITSPIIGAVLAILFILHSLEFIMMNYGRGVGEVWEINNYTILLIKCIAVVTLLPVLIYASPWLLVRFIKETREDRRRLAELRRVIEDDGIPTEWEMATRHDEIGNVWISTNNGGDEVPPPDDDKLYDKMSPRRRMMNHKIDMTK